MPCVAFARLAIYPLLLAFLSGRRRNKAGEMMAFLLRASPRTLSSALMLARCRVSSPTGADW